MSNLIMSDSNTLRSAISESIKEDSEHVTNSDNQQKVEQKPQEEVNKTTPVEDVPAFAEKVETKGRTPEELDAIYQQWNKSYTQKRQSERAEIRRLQEENASFKQRIDEIEKRGQSIKDPGLQEEKNEVQKDFDMGRLTLEQYTQKMRELVKDDARLIADEIFDEKFKAREEDSTQNILLEKFNAVDPRFDNRYINPDSPEFNKTNAWLYQQIAGRMADELDTYIKENGSSRGFKVDEVAKKHITEIDGYIDSVVKSRVQTNANQLRQRASETAKSNPRGVTSVSQTTQRKGLRELIEEKVDG